MGVDILIIYLYIKIVYRNYYTFIFTYPITNHFDSVAVWFMSKMYKCQISSAFCAGIFKQQRHSLSAIDGV